MRICFGIGGLLLATACALEAAGNPEPSGKVTLVVKADPRSGRLVRRVSAPRPPAPTTDDIPAVIEETARLHNLDPLLVHSVIKVESNYNKYAISPKGAEGLMQLIPSTARRFGVRNPFDPTENITGGVKYLKHLIELYDQNLILALAAYNAGEGAVARHNNTIPPYPETRDYVRKVEQKLGEAQKAAAMNQAAAPKTETSSPGEHNPIETLMDADGRIYYLTR
jgi:Transglycosylase SLT domain